MTNRKRSGFLDGRSGLRRRRSLPDFDHDPAVGGLADAVGGGDRLVVLSAPCGHQVGLADAATDERLRDRGGATLRQRAVVLGACRAVGVADDADRAGTAGAKLVDRGVEQRLVLGRQLRAVETEQQGRDVGLREGGSDDDDGDRRSEKMMAHVTLRRWRIVRAGSRGPFGPGRRRNDRMALNCVRRCRQTDSPGFYAGAELRPTTHGGCVHAWPTVSWGYSAAAEKAS
jgi:hypothetical protein